MFSLFFLFAKRNFPGIVINVFPYFWTCLWLNQKYSWSVTRKVLVENNDFFLFGTWLLKIIWVSGKGVYQFWYMNEKIFIIFYYLLSFLNAPKVCTAFIFYVFSCLSRNICFHWMSMFAASSAAVLMYAVSSTTVLIVVATLVFLGYEA